MTGGYYFPYNEIGIDTLDDYTMLLNFLGKCGRERVNECFGAGVCGEHGGGDNPAERADIQYQPVFPVFGLAEGPLVSKSQDALFDHPRKHHSCDPDSSIDIDCNDIGKFGGLGLREVHRVRV